MVPSFAAAHADLHNHASATPASQQHRELSVGFIVVPTAVKNNQDNQELAMRTVWLRVLAVSAGLGLMIAAGVAQGPKGEPEQSFKQMKLSDKKVQAFIAAQKQLAPLATKLEAQGEKGDPALQKQVEQIAKSNGFASLEELGDVSSNISIVLAGLDPKTGQFTEPPELIKREMEQIKQDKQMSQKDKDEALAEMRQALKVATPLQFKENIAVVKKYQKELDDVLGPEDKK
jgi:hypothetical protein